MRLLYYGGDSISPEGTMKAIFGRKLSIRSKLIIPLTLAFGVMIILIVGFVDEFLEVTANKIFEREIHALSGQVIQCIDADSLASFHSNPVPDENLRTIMDCFSPIKEVNPLATLVTYYLNEDDQLVIGANSELEADPGRMFPGELLDENKMAFYFGEDITDAPIIEERLRSGLTEVTFQDQYYANKSGDVFFVGYLPIPEANAGLIIYVGAGEISNDLSNFELYLSIGVFIAFILIFMITFGVATRSTASLRRLNSAAENAAQGDYEEVKISDSEMFPDEVTNLTAVFNEMVAKVYTREQDLAEKVTELKIFIDEGRKKEELDQIVDSDFFQDLQSRARIMRGRFVKE